MASEASSATRTARAVVDVAEVGEDALLRHDEHAEEPSLAFALSCLTLQTVGTAPVGIFRDVGRPVYDDLMGAQVEEARDERGEASQAALLQSGDTWQVA